MIVGRGNAFLQLLTNLHVTYDFHSGDFDHISQYASHIETPPTLVKNFLKIAVMQM